MNEGDILITRNTEEVGNPFPGYWNHVAIVSVNDWVVEAQIDPNKVIAVPLDKFLLRYPEIKVVRDVQANAHDLAVTAMQFVGLPYAKVKVLGMIFAKRSAGVTCVSLLRRIYWSVTNKDPLWFLPDDVSDDKNLTKIDYLLNENWVTPKVWYEGMITEPIYG